MYIKRIKLCPLREIHKKKAQDEASLPWQDCPLGRIFLLLRLRNDKPTLR